MSAYAGLAEPDSSLSRLRAAYDLLAELCERGPVPGLRRAALASPLLAEALSADRSQDELEVEHTRAFDLEVHPSAGAFLHESGCAGAGVDSLRAAYARIGFSGAECGPGLDHLATELRALARCDPGAEHAAARRALIDEHLAAWLPIWVDAVQRLGLSWPAALADQIEALVAFDRARLGGDVRNAAGLGADDGRTGAAALPDLDAAKTDLRAIAAALARADCIGVFLSHHDIAGLARAARTPTGFGPRRLLLENALENAVHLGTLDAFLSNLVSFLEAAGAAGRMQARAEQPGFSVAVRSISGRILASCAWLEAMRRAARARNG